MPLPGCLFVTGTDTGVGKTVVTAALVASVTGGLGLKPLASGVPQGAPGEDAALLALASGGAPESYRRWVPPVSPHRAILEGGQGAELGDVVAWIAARQRPQTCVEGVGGWRVPIAESWGIRELAQALGWPVLIVAANRLGVLNHARLTAEAVAAAGLTVAAVILNEAAAPLSPDDDAQARAHNLADLRLLMDAPVAELPRLSALSRPALAAAGAALRAQL